MRLKKSFVIILALACMLSVMTACKKKEEEQPDAEKTTYTVSVLNSMDELADGGTYIRHGDKFLTPYINQASFGADENYSRSVDPSRVAWFMDDFESIPTMYKEDTLVFRSLADFSEEFNLERFQDLGYTVGISNLEKRDSGRYYLDTDSSKYKYINIESDAAKLFKFGKRNVTIEVVGGSRLRSGNVTASGTIRGLSQGKKYKADVYTGTVLNECDLIADCRAMASMERITVKDYEFLRSDIIEIKLPDDLQTGYYMVNGFGIIRYVNGDTYDEKTDFNVPNIKEEKKPLSDLPNYNASLEEENDVLAGTEVIYLPAESEYRVRLKYTKLAGETRPKAYLTQGDKVVELRTDVRDNTLVYEGTLNGVYLLQAYNMEEDYSYTTEDLIKMTDEQTEAALQKEQEVNEIIEVVEQESTSSDEAQ